MMYETNDGKYVIWYGTTIFSSMDIHFKEMAPLSNDGAEKNTYQ